MIDVRLTATNPEDSTLVPVPCNARGELLTVAPKIESIPNDVVINGDLTVTGLINGQDLSSKIELPPGAFDGAYLGWQDGQLVWFGTPLPPVLEGSFRPVIYTGNGGAQSITGVGFSPDLVWIKSREDASHALCNSISGFNKRLKSNNTDAEYIYNPPVIASANDGFDLLTSDPDHNANTVPYVAWCWDAGNTTVTNNDGTIESQVRSNGDFSVVKYVGTGSPATIGIGLNSAPKMIITKNITSNASWAVYHSALGNGKLLELEKSGSARDSGSAWNSTDPTSSSFSVGNYPDTNNNSESYIGYCWAEMPGISSFGEFSGNGSRNTVVTGFRPSFVIIKSIRLGNWYMFDNARGTSQALYSNLAEKESNTGAVEFLEDGFQLLFGLPGANESGETYIYAAFANPEDAAFAQRQLRSQARQEERQQNETLLR